MDTKELYDIVEHTIDYAFNGKYMLNMYDYLVLTKATKSSTSEFLQSSTRTEIDQLIIDLDDYLEGGSDEKHKQLREGYGHLGKPEARKIRNYLNGILEDALKYEQEKRPGRKRKPSK
jgi:hypothetical protein